MALLVFVPAGTLDYGQAWVFIGLFVGASTLLTIDLLIRDPDLLERRMRAGPRAETRTPQKIVMVIVMVGYTALLVLSGLDHRFGWTPVPVTVVVLGDALVVVGFAVIYRVMRANSFAASTIQVDPRQTVVSTGPYAVVRHPMYAGGLLLFVGMPLALGSWSGLLGVLALFPALLWRIFDEEKLLTESLPGYAEYKEKVRARLVPGVF